MVRNSKPPRGLRVTRFEVGGERYVVLSYPVPTTDPLARLTPAEREVIALALEGWTSAAIAAARGSQKRTVDKQIEAAYRKIGVSSRAELAAWYASGAPDRGPAGTR